MAQYSLNEVLKQKEASKNQVNESDEVKLDDVTRVKVLSPMRQVMKRFLRNRLAIVGSIILITMFVFCFLGPIFYPYGQKDTFYRHEKMSVDYAQAKTNVIFNPYTVDDSVEFDGDEKDMMNSRVKSMIEDGRDKLLGVNEDGACCYIEKVADNVYTLGRADATLICAVGGSEYLVGVYDGLGKGEITFAEGTEEIPGLFAAAKKEIKGNEGSLELDGVTYNFRKEFNGEKVDGKKYFVTAFSDGIVYNREKMDAGFESALTKAAEAGEDFSYGGKDYMLVEVKEDSYYAFEFKGSKPGLVYSTLIFSSYETGAKISDEFKANAFMAAAEGGEFTADGETYTLTSEGGYLTVTKADGTEFGEFGPMSIRRNTGGDTMDYQLKKDIIGAIEQIEQMGPNEEKIAKITTVLPQQNEKGEYDYDDEGNLLYADSELVITSTEAGYKVSCEQIRFVYDKYAAPSLQHLLGTDGHGMDVLARVMYGGRVSLMVGFVVVIIETILGVIMGGISGYFGGWVDTVIMRLVDIFYCLPSLPIMIIIGAMMDAVRMDPYTRLIIMMAALGVMGWAGVARLVRGQILSLREQEFMVATEATGVKVRARIFRHLVPNVMPQLIVSATMGLGGVILEESTLSFLGLGVKHPMATWGTMINSVSTASAMAHYAYIWIPVGLLICLTVIAFNFVGDGLRDAFDPRSKR